jgi:hypothetical protein
MNSKFKFLKRNEKIDKEIKKKNNKKSRSFKVVAKIKSLKIFLGTEKVYSFFSNL